MLGPLPWGDEHVMVVSFDPYAIHLFRRSDGQFVERHPLNTPAESVVPGSEGLWLSGAHYAARSAIRRLMVGDSDQRRTVRPLQREPSIRRQVVRKPGAKHSFNKALHPFVGAREESFSRSADAPSESWRTSVMGIRVQSPNRPARVLRLHDDGLRGSRRVGTFFARRGRIRPLSASSIEVQREASRGPFPHAPTTFEPCDFRECLRSPGSLSHSDRGKRTKRIPRRPDLRDIGRIWHRLWCHLLGHENERKVSPRLNFCVDDDIRRRRGVSAWSSPTRAPLPPPGWPGTSRR